MIKKYGKYIILAVVIAVFAGAYVIISNIEQIGDEENKYPSPDDREVIYSITSDDIKTIGVSNSNGKYTLSYEDGLKILEYPSVTVNETQFNTTASEFSQIRPDVVMEEGMAQLSNFGLEFPKAQITVTAKDGAVADFYLGDPTPVGNGYYMRMDDKTTVYLLQTYKAELFFKSVSDYRQGDLLVFDSAEVDRITLERADGIIMEFVRNEVPKEEASHNIFTVYNMTKPYQWPAESTFVSQILNSVVNAKIAEFTPFGSAPADYGLSPHQAKITFARGQNTDVVYVGRAGTQNRYISVNGDSEIFGVINENFDYLTKEVTAFVTRSAFIKNIGTVSSIHYKSADAEKIFEIKEADEETYDVFIDGKLSGWQDFITFYQELVSITTAGPISYQISSEPYFYYEFVYTDGTKGKAEYYAVDDRRLALAVDGKVQFYVNKAELMERIQKMDSYINSL